MVKYQKKELGWKEMHCKWLNSSLASQPAPDSTRENRIGYAASPGAIMTDSNFVKALHEILEVIKTDIRRKIKSISEADSKYGRYCSIFISNGVKSYQIQR